MTGYSSRSGKGSLRLGTMGWSYRFWVGPLYPAGTKPERYLAEYAKRFDTVEADSTFYRIPRESTVKSWADQTPPGFKFAVKFPQAVTHQPGLRYDPDDADAFMERIKLLGEKLGPVLLQFPATLKPDLPAFRGLLDNLPRGLYAAEFRNKGWLTEETLQLLKDRNIALATVNKPWGATAATADWIYLRWEGDRSKVSGEKGVAEMDRRKENMELADLLSGYLENGLDVYGYFSKYYSGYPPGDVAEVKKALDERG